MLLGVKDIIPEISLSGQQEKKNPINKKKQLRPVEVPNLLKGNKQIIETTSNLITNKKDSLSSNPNINVNDINSKKIIFNKNTNPKIIPKEKSEKINSTSNSINEKNLESLGVSTNSEYNSSANREEIW